MATNLGIPAKNVTIEWKHAAWTPEDIAGTAISGKSQGDYQEFDDDEGMNFNIDGESGFEIPALEAGSTTSDGEEYISPQYKMSQARNITFNCVAGLNRFADKFFYTVYTDSQNRPATLRETWASGNTNTTEFIVTKYAQSLDKGGVLMTNVTIQPAAPTVIARS